METKHIPYHKINCSAQCRNCINITTYKNSVYKYCVFAVYFYSLIDRRIETKHPKSCDWQQMYCFMWPLISQFH